MRDKGGTGTNEGVPAAEEKAMAVLTQEQRDFYAEKGFLPYRGILEDAEVERLRTE